MGSVLNLGLKRISCSFAAAIFILFSALSTTANADSSNNGFSVLITPSPLVATVNPGHVTTLQLRILNNSNSLENLSIAARSFSVNSTSGQVAISNSVPTSVNSWITFSAPNFSIDNGQWFTESIALNVPADAGFSYHFALSITKRGGPVISQGRLINASVDDFVLLNINRPGAKESLSLKSFTVSKHVYQWLPAKFSVDLQNTGNTIVQPSGNIFIKRSASSKNSIDTLNLNSGGGYILPGSDRIFSGSWSNGFPVYRSQTAANGTTTNHLSWSLSNSSSFRFGKYTASLVAIYNNGVSDVPINANVSFWVLPWVLLVIVLAVLVVFGFGLWSIGRRLVTPIKKRKGKKSSISE